MQLVLKKYELPSLFQYSNEGLELERHLNEIGFLSEESRGVFNSPEWFLSI